VLYGRSVYGDGLDDVTLRTDIMRCATVFLMLRMLLGGLLLLQQNIVDAPMNMSWSVVVPSSHTVNVQLAQCGGTLLGGSTKESARSLCNPRGCYTEITSKSFLSRGSTHEVHAAAATVSQRPAGI
jgi:hypothetical protein